MGLAKNLSILGFVAGCLIIITVGVVAWVVVPNIVDNKIKEETRLLNGTDTWDKWQNITIPIKLRFYIFNITNPKADLTNRNFTKLNFVEKGPYVYDEYRFKQNITIDETLDTVKYAQNITYVFNRGESIGDETDLFNIPNVPLISVGTKGYSDKFGNESELVKLRSVMTYLTLLASPKETLIKENVSVSEILFKGWDITSYGIIKDRSPEDFPPEFEGLRFGFYRGKNQSSDGVYVVHNGADDSDDFGRIDTWEGKKELDWWYTEDLDETSNQHYCNKINGTDGSIFSPFNDKGTTLRLFNTDVCRSLFLTYDSEMEHEEIPGYRYTLPKEMFQHPDVNPDNACFCQKRQGLANQCAEGVIRIYPCKNGAPIVTSNPRFLDAGEEFFEAITMEKPNREKHTTFIEIEPDSGMLLRASKKIQISVELQNIERVSPFSSLNFSTVTNSSSILLPIFWAEEFAELDEENAKDLYDKLLKPLKAVNLARWIVIGIAAAIVLISAVVFFKTR